MLSNFTRRSVMAAGALLFAASLTPALAQDKIKLRFSAVFSEQDIRADMMKQFADEIGSHPS